MGLIDADDFKRILDSQELMEHLCKVGRRNSQNLSFALAQIIDNRPIAYDVDKVVEQLEELTGEECTMHECGIRSEHCKSCIAKKAIEIVKASGLVSNQDNFDAKR